MAVNDVLYDKGGAVFNVKNSDYGATGNGSTNDYTAINTAHTAATASGGILHFPAGTYRVGTNLTIASDVTLSFAPGATLKPDSGITITVNGPLHAGLQQCFDLSSAGSIIFGATSVQEIHPHWFGFSTSASGTVNKAAAQAAFDAGTASRMTVVFPAGEFDWTGTATNGNCPFFGAGDEVTFFRPTTSTPCFDIELSHGHFGRFAIYFTVEAVYITSSAVGFRLLIFNQARAEHVTVARGFHAFTVESGVGDGYIWQAHFDHIISAYCKDSAFKIDSATDSTTVKFSNCHVYAKAEGDPWSNWTTSKGWYVRNLSSIELSNCSMDGGDPDSPSGTVLDIQGAKVIKITGAFHHEDYTQLAGGTTNTPMILGAAVVNIDALLLVVYEVDVGGGNTAYYFRTTTSPSYLVLGDIVELGSSITSGTKIYGRISGFSGVNVLSKQLSRAQFYEESANAKNLFASEHFNDPNIRQYSTGVDVTCNSMGATEILVLPRRDPSFARYDTALVFVRGHYASTGAGFGDLVTIVSATNGATTAQSVASSDNGGGPPARTYSLTTDSNGVHLKLQLASSIQVVFAHAISSISWFTVP